MAERLDMKLTGPESTERLGRVLAGICRPPCLIALQGELGAGKTTLARGFLQALGVRDAVKSPTYTLVEPYEESGCPVYHYDLYRIGAAAEMEFLGMRDYLSETAIHLVEWPERAEGRLGPFDLHIHLQHAGTARRAGISVDTDLGRSWLEQLRSLVSTFDS